METSPWWSILVAPIATIAGVVLGSGISWYLSYRQMKLTIARERAQLHISILQTEFAAILEYTDRVALTAETSRREVVTWLFQMSKTDAMPDIQLKLSTEFNSLVLAGSVARTHALGLSKPMDEQLHELLSAVSRVNDICEGITPALTHKQRSEVVGKMKNEIEELFQECGRIRRAARVLIMTWADTPLEFM